MPVIKFLHPCVWETRSLLSLSSSPPPFPTLHPHAPEGSRDLHCHGLHGNAEDLGPMSGMSISSVVWGDKDICTHFLHSKAEKRRLAQLDSVRKCLLRELFNNITSVWILEKAHYPHVSNKSPVQFSSVQFSCSVLSDSLRPHGLQYARPPCLSPTPRVHSNSCPLSQWSHPAISSSVVPFSSCPQSLLASESFPVSQSSHEVAKVLEFQLQHQSFQWALRTDSNEFFLTAE